MYCRLINEQLLSSDVDGTHKSAHDGPPLLAVMCRCHSGTDPGSVKGFVGRSSIGMQGKTPVQEYANHSTVMYSTLKKTVGGLQYFVNPVLQTAVSRLISSDLISS